MCTFTLHLGIYNDEGAAATAGAKASVSRCCGHRGRCLGRLSTVTTQAAGAADDGVAAAHSPTPCTTSEGGDRASHVRRQYSRISASDCVLEVFGGSCHLDDALSASNLGLAAPLF